MKILAVLFLHPRIMAGYEIFLSDLAEKLRTAGHSCTLAFPSRTCPEMTELLRKNRTDCLVVPDWAHNTNRLKQNNLALLVFLTRLFRRERFDVVDFHFCGEIPIFLFGVYALINRRKIRLVWHQHSEIIPTNNVFKHNFSKIRLVSLVVDAFVVPSRRLQEALIRRGISRNRIWIIANGITDPGSADRAAEDTENVKLLTVASLRPIKGLPYLLQALEKVVRRSNQNITLSIAGDGPDEEKLQDLAKTLGIADRVHFLGLKRDIPTLLKAADIFVLPSLQESFGISALEAMSCGLPVVASAVGGLPEIISDGRNGFLVPARDPNSLAEAILKLAGNPLLRAEMGREGRRIFLAGFTLDKMVREHLALYREYA